jgi:hypothetical protein
MHTRSMFGAVSCLVERPMCLKYRQPISVPLFHEIDESGIDPELNTYVSVWLAPIGGGAPVVTRILKEICDPVTASIVTVNGIAGFPNIVGPRFFSESQTGRLDLLGVVDAPLPTIPRLGCIERTDGSLQYGDDVTPLMREFLEEKKGRRWLVRNKHLRSLGGGL